jgi:Tol biopolymer transport system component
MSKSLKTGQSTEIYRFNPYCSAFLPAISPDGKNILFQMNRDFGEDPNEWAMVSMDGGALKKVKMPVAPGDVSDFKWARDGKSILYATTENGVANIWSVSLDGAHPKKLTDFRSDELFSFDVSSDNRIVASRGTEPADLVLLEKVK